jgi:succinyl-CoA synthetase beta subunit
VVEIGCKCECGLLQGPVIIASSQGGVNIEDVAAENPDAILKIPIDIQEGLSADKALSVAKQLGFGDKSNEISQMFLRVYELFCKSDALMVELNPLAEDSNGECKLL